MTIAVMLAAAAVGQVPTPVRVEPPPAPMQAIVALTPGEAMCDGAQVRAATLVRPIPAAVSLAPGQAIAPFVFAFRIDADGRPLGIAPEPRVMTGNYFAPTDLQPALAATRFTAGAPRARCTIRYVAAAAAIADAPIDLIYRYIALPHDRHFLDTAVQKRVRDATAGCYGDKPPTILTRSYPDYDAIPQPQGALSMSITGFDIDASGRPVRVRTVTSDGNAALDAAARDAVARSRFGKGARTGCSAPAFRRQSIPLSPPPPPSLDDYRNADGACDANGGGGWQLPPRMTFPEPFRRRAIEGWAVVRYDVAPWGQTGNVAVVASEPAAMFGETARTIIMSARRSPSTRGATGCVERVLFKLPEGNTEEAPLPPVPAPIID